MCSAAASSVLTDACSRAGGAQKGRTVSVPCSQTPTCAAPQTMHILEERPCTRDVAEHQVLLQCLRAKPGRAPQAGEHGLDLRGEDQRVAASSVEQRLDPQMISRQQDSLALHVVNREREHAVQFSHKVVAELLVRMDEPFGIAVRSKAMAALEQALCQLSVVLDVAIESDPDGSILVGEGLRATVNVDDAQTAVSEADSGDAMHAFTIGTAMRNGVAHRDNATLVNGL